MNTDFKSTHSAFFNRLRKQLKSKQVKADQHQISAFRIYNLDIPEYPYIIDKYGEKFVFFDRTDPFREKDQKYLREILMELNEELQLQPEQLIVKKRKQQKGDDQYFKFDQKNLTEIAKEKDLNFIVNLHDYLDTGLFLDHRVLRQWLRVKKFPGARLLNLFCYTGSLSVAAAKGGYQTTSVDLSNTYLQWARENFSANHLHLSNHEFINADVLSFLKEHRFPLSYDVILIDPPTFSNSKKMDQDFEVERDQDFLIEQAIQYLAPKGIILFSNNKRGFRLSEKLSRFYTIRDLTEPSIPFDFQGPSKPHVLFQISLR